MSVFSQSKPTYLKTYGKQKRKVDQWFSPDLRKKAFSFSSTPSSDQSIPELTSRTRKTTKTKISTASTRILRKRTKRKALEALNELESDEESVLIPRTSRRRKPSAKLIKKTVVTRSSPGLSSSNEEHASRHTVRMRKKPPRISNSENESDTFLTKDICSNASRKRASNVKCITHGKSVALPNVDRFVTRRKRLPMQPMKNTFEQSLGLSSNTLNPSKDIISGVPSFPHPVTNCKQSSTHQESDTKPSVMLHSGAHRHSGRVLSEVSFNDVEERMTSCKRPLLCSTPSLVSKQSLRCLEPSISEISSFSCDELDMPPPLKESTASDLMSKPLYPGTLQKSKQRENRTPKVKTVQQMEEHVSAHSKLGLEKDKTCSSTEIVSTLPHLKQLKEQSVIILEELDGLDIFPRDNGKQTGLEAGPATTDIAMPSCNDKRTFHMSSDNPMSNASTQALHLSSLSPSSVSSPSSISAPPVYEVSSSLLKQIDHLKVKCMLSRLTVRLQRLEPRTILQTHQETTETHKAHVASSHSLEIKRGRNSRNLNFPCLRDTESGVQSSVSDLHTEGPVQQMSASFMQPVTSPEPIKAPSKMTEAKELSGLCTSRKVCVSGLNSSRWSKRGVGEHNIKRRQNESWTKPADCSSSAMLLTGADSYMGESAWLQSSRVFGLPKTPLRAELLNLSSFLTSFTPDSLTTHTWGRLKAALSIHKKKTAFPTPRRLALSDLKHPGLADTSLELFGTPAPNQVSSHLLRSSVTHASMLSFSEDISDAEKVYQECQQEGPLCFDDCIPPECMKHCIKIGEGTFGEVFSMVNTAAQTVALKIIPVEGHQKVNGEPQKSCGEVLHEIIISKELSALNSKEHNKTNGFIGLINLHCVRGCYPSALLKAWDQFDQEKGSENDRPDFFGKEQLFLILEFEFGGSDLENMNGKLTSMAQAKSVLHQVTAALAVAEEALCFEHRDLHWGNILVKNTKEKRNQFILNGSTYTIETRGVHVNIIDYSLSRLEIDGLTVSCDITNEEELFMGQGDYQFEIYRLMKKENNNCWADYNPHSNVLWLHYLADKLLTMKYKNKPHTSQQKALKNSLKSFFSEILNYHSAKDVLLHAALFQ